MGPRPCLKRLITCGATGGSVKACGEQPVSSPFAHLPWQLELCLGALALRVASHPSLHGVDRGELTMQGCTCQVAANPPLRKQDCAPDGNAQQPVAIPGEPAAPSRLETLRPGTTLQDGQNEAASVQAPPGCLERASSSKRAQGQARSSANASEGWQCEAAGAQPRHTACTVRAAFSRQQRRRAWVPRAAACSLRAALSWRQVIRARMPRSVACSLRAALSRPGALAAANTIKR
eukprot:3071929-Prymnesium_polylepis.3